MYDKIEIIGKSTIQHGKYNDRIYIMKIAPAELNNIFTKVDNLIRKYSYSKLFAKVPIESLEFFINKGFVKEAEIPNFYNNEISVVFLSKYIANERGVISTAEQDEINKVLQTALNRGTLTEKIDLPAGFSIMQLNHSHADALAKLYKEVFASYPFPIFDPGYIKETMDTNINYFGILNKDNILISASSAEIDYNGKNVEMTDFATDPNFPGHGFGVILLNQMEKAMGKINIRSFYTISRALSYGINITFSKMGYKYAGLLINNTNIFGKIESMNVWYKNNL